MMYMKAIGHSRWYAGPNTRRTFDGSNIPRPAIAVGCAGDRRCSTRRQIPSRKPSRETPWDNHESVWFIAPLRSNERQLTAGGAPIFVPGRSLSVAGQGRRSRMQRTKTLIIIVQAKSMPNLYMLDCQ